MDVKHVLHAALDIMNLLRVRLLLMLFVLHAQFAANTTILHLHVPLLLMLSAVPV